MNHLALVPWRRTEGQHWTERARVLWPVRTTAMSQILLVPILAVCCVLILWPVRLEVLPVVFLASWCGAILGTWSLDRAIFPRLTFRQWLNEVSLAWLLRFGLWFVWLAFMWLMPLDPGWPMAALLLGMVLLHLVWFRTSMALLRLCGVVTDPDARLARIVAAASARAGVPVRRTSVAGGCSLNALAYTLSGQLVFTRRLLEELDDEELDGVCAHEISHLGESRSVKAARFLGSLSTVPLLLIRPAIEHAGFNGIAGLGLLVLVLKRIARRTSQRMEKRADDLAAGAQVAPGVYARALEKIYRGNQAPAVMPGSSMAHPHLYQRMLDTGVQADFPRPLPAARRCWHAWLLFLLVPILSGWAAHAYLERQASDAHLSEETLSTTWDAPRQIEDDPDLAPKKESR